MQNAGWSERNVFKNFHVRKKIVGLKNDSDSTANRIQISFESGHIKFLVDNNASGVNCF